MVFTEEWGTERVEREFGEAGLACCTYANPLGFRCGYVALPPGHPLHGASCAETHGAVEGLSCNGDLTYSAPLGDMWALGWDAGHLWNAPDPGLLGPEARARFGERPWEFHRGEPGAHVVGADEAESITRSLARSLARAEGGALA